MIKYSKWGLSIDMGLAKLLSLVRVILFVCIVRCIAAQATTTKTSSMSFLYPLPTTAPLLTVNAYDTVVVEWESNYDATWLVLYCNEYKPEDNGKMVMYMCESGLQTIDK